MIRCRILGHDWRPDRLYLFGVCRRCGIPADTAQPWQNDPLGDEIRASLRRLQESLGGSWCSAYWGNASCALRRGHEGPHLDEYGIRPVSDLLLGGPVRTVVAEP